VTDEIKGSLLWQVMQVAYAAKNSARRFCEVATSLSAGRNLTGEQAEMAGEALDIGKELLVTFDDYLPKPGRFVVHEQMSGFRVEDTETGEDHWLSDGVDCVPDPGGGELDMLPPGGELFCLLWAEQFNEDVAQTLEAYWPDQYEKEYA